MTALAARVAGGTAAAVHAAGRDIGEISCAVDAIEVVVSRVGAMDLCLVGLDGVVGLGDAVIVFCSARHDFVVFLEVCRWDGLV